MNITKFVTLTAIAAALTFSVAGCKKKPQKVTPLPGQAAVTPGGGAEPVSPGTGLTPAGTGMGTGVTGTDVTPPKLGANESVMAATGDISNWPKDREWGKSYTVYFDFDRSVIRPSEASKIDGAAAKFKSGDPSAALQIEGHCDERGTAEYNRALGERRALAVREYLVRAGVNPERVHTVSFGKDQPAVIGHDEAAYAKNRRGEFILATPPK